LIPAGALPRILDDLSACPEQKRRKSPQSPDWAGYIVADTLGWDRPEKKTSDFGTLERIVTELLRQGHLTEMTVKDERSKLVKIFQVVDQSGQSA
jgi:hypothetical protein